MTQVDMQISNDLNNLIDEKQLNSNSEALPLWDQLTLAQEFAACSLGQFGYVLVHIQEASFGKEAVLSLNGKLATISENGYINVNPSHFN